MFLSSRKLRLQPQPFPSVLPSRCWTPLTAPGALWGCGSTQCAWACSKTARWVQLSQASCRVGWLCSRGVQGGRWEVQPSALQ